MKRTLSLVLAVFMVFSCCATLFTFVASAETEAEIVDAAFNLEKGAALEGEKTLTGPVAKIVTAYNSKFDNITVNITVKNSAGEDKTLQCYRLAGGADLNVGDTIRVTGTIKNYNGTIEFDAGATYELVARKPGKYPIKTFAGYAGGDVNIFVRQGEKITLGAVSDNGARDFNYYKVILVNAEGKVTEILTNLGRADVPHSEGDGRKDNVEIPDGGFAIGFHNDALVAEGSVYADLFGEGTILEKNARIQLVNVDLEALATTAAGTALEYASFNLLERLPETEDEILDAAFALAEGDFLEGTYTLPGVVTEVVTEFSEANKNITVNMKVKGDRTVQCYRLKAESATSVIAGDSIKVTGSLKNYKGTVEFDSGCTFEMVEHVHVKGEYELDKGFRVAKCSRCGEVIMEVLDKSYNEPIDITVSHVNAYSWGSFDSMILSKAGQTVQQICGYSCQWWIAYVIEPNEAGEYVAVKYQKNDATNGDLVVPEGGFIWVTYSAYPSYAAADNGALVGYKFYPSWDISLGMAIDTSKNPELVKHMYVANPGELLYDWEDDAWVKATVGDNAGWQNDAYAPAEGATDVLGPEYQYRIEDGYLYAAVKYNLPMTKGTGNGNSTFFRLWVKTDPAQTSYRYFYDVYVQADGTLGHRAADNASGTLVGKNSPVDNNDSAYTYNMIPYAGGALAEMRIPLEEIGADSYLAIYLTASIEKVTGGATNNQCLYMPALGDAHITSGTWTADHGNVGFLLTSIDGEFTDDIWEGVEWIQVNKDNARWQSVTEAKGEAFSYKFAITDDGEYLYVAAESEAAGQTQFRFWINNGSGSVYTSFVDLFVANTNHAAKYNTSVIRNAGAVLENSSLIAAVKAGETKTGYEFKIKLSDLGIDLTKGFGYFTALTASTAEAGKTDGVYYPAPAGTATENMPYRTNGWDFDNEGLYKKEATPIGAGAYKVATFSGYVADKPDIAIFARLESGEKTLNEIANKMYNRTSTVYNMYKAFVVDADGKVVAVNPVTDAGKSEPSLKGDLEIPEGGYAIGVRDVEGQDAGLLAAVDAMQVGDEVKLYGADLAKLAKIDKQDGYIDHISFDIYAKERIFDLGEVKNVNEISFTPDNAEGLANVKISLSLDGVEYYDMNNNGVISASGGKYAPNMKTRGVFKAQYIKVTGEPNVNGTIAIVEGAADKARDPKGPYSLTGLNASGYGSTLFTSGTVDTNQGKDSGLNIAGSQLVIGQKVASGVYKMLVSSVNAWPGGGHSDITSAIEGIAIEDGVITLGEGQVALVIMSSGAYATAGDEEASPAKHIARGLANNGYFRVDGEQYTFHSVEPEPVPTKIDGNLSDDLWTGVEFKKVDGVNAGTWQNKVSDFTYEYAIVEDDGYVYIAVKSDKADMTQLRVWFHTNPEAKLYTHFFDVYTNGNAGGLKTNKSLTVNSGSDYDASKLEAAFDANKQIFEARVKLADIGATTLGENDCNIQLGDGNNLFSRDLLPGNFTIDGTMVNSAYMPWVGWFEGQIPTYAGLIPKTNHWVRTPVTIGDVTGNVTYYYVDDALHVSGDNYWPFITCVYPLADVQTYEIEGNELHYSFSVENGNANIRLKFLAGDQVVSFMLENTALGLSADQYIASSGDLLPGTFSGVIKLADLVASTELYANGAFPAEAIQDGKLTFAGLEIYAINGATVYISELGVEETPYVGAYQIKKFAGYVSGDVSILVRQGEKKTVSELTGGKDYNAYALIIVDEDGFVSELDLRGPGRPAGVKSDVEVPEGGFIIAINRDATGYPIKLVEEAFVADGVKVDDEIKVYGIDLDKLAEVGVAGDDLAGVTFDVISNDFEEVPEGAYAIEYAQDWMGDISVIYTPLATGEKTLGEITAVTTGKAQDCTWWNAIIVDADGIVVKTIGMVDKKDEEIPAGGYMIAAHGGSAVLNILPAIPVGSKVTLYNCDLEAFANLTDGVKLRKAAFTYEEPIVERPISYQKSYTVTGNTRTDSWKDDGIRLTDGIVTDQGGNALSAGLPCADGPSVTVDLGDLYNVDKFTVHAYGGQWGITIIDGFTVAVSEDGETFTAVDASSTKDEPVGNWQATWFTITLDNPVKARYVKFLPVGGNYLWGDEVEVWESDKEPVEPDEPVTEKVFDLGEVKNVNEIYFTPANAEGLANVKISLSLDGVEYYDMNNNSAITANGEGKYAPNMKTRGVFKAQYIKVTGEPDVNGTVEIVEGSADAARDPKGPYSLTGLNESGYGSTLISSGTVDTNQGKDSGLNIAGAQLVIGQEVANGVYKMLVSSVNAWPSGGHSDITSAIDGITIEDGVITLGEGQVALVIISSGAYATAGDEETSPAKHIARGLANNGFFRVDGEQYTFHSVEPEAVPAFAAPAIDGVLDDEFWTAAEFKTVDGMTRGTWQNKVSGFTFDYALVVEGEYVYIAVKSDKTDMTQLRVWFHTNPEAKLYTHFFDVYTNGNPGGLKTNKSLTTNSGSDYDASKLEAAFDENKQVFEARVKLADIGATKLGENDYNIQLGDGNNLFSQDLLPGNFTIDGTMVNSAYMPWVGWFEGQIPTYAGLIPKTNHWVLTPIGTDYVKYYYIDDALVVVDEASWPFMDHIYPEGDEQTYAIEGNQLRYNFSIENGTASIRLIFKTADGTVQYMMTNTALGLTSDQYYASNGDFKATSCSGVITLQELVESQQLYQNSDFPAEAIINGEITFAGIEIWAIGGATVVMNELAVEPIPSLEPDNYLWMKADASQAPAIKIVVPADEFEEGEPLTIQALVQFSEDCTGEGCAYLNCYPYNGTDLLSWVDYAATNIQTLGEWHEINLENYIPAKNGIQPDRLEFSVGFWNQTGTISIGYIKVLQGEKELLALTFENGYDLTGASGMTLENKGTVWDVVGAQEEEPSDELALHVSHLNLYNWNQFDIMLATVANIKALSNWDGGVVVADNVLYTVELVGSQYVVKEFITGDVMNETACPNGGLLLFVSKNNRDYDLVANGELVGKELVFVDFDLKTPFAIDTTVNPAAAYTMIAKDYAPSEPGIPVSRDKSYTYPVNTRTDNWAEDGVKLTDGVMTVDGNSYGYSGWGSEVAIVVDLGYKYSVDKFDVEAAANSGWGISMPEGFKVSYSLDGENFTDIDAASVKGEETATGGWVSAIYTIELEEAVKARYVKFSIVRKNTFVWIDEVEVWEAGNHEIIEEPNPVQPDELADLPSDAIVIDYAGYKHAGVVSIVAGDNQTVAEVTARGNGGAAKDMNYAYNILVDKDNLVIDVDFTLAQACTFVIPEGGYIISYNGNKDGYNVMTGIEVGARIKLYNIILDPIRTLEGNVELTQAGFTYDNTGAPEPFEKTVVVKDNEILTDGDSGFEGGWGDVGTAKVLLVANEKCTEAPMVVTILHELDEVKKLQGYKLDLYHCANVMIGYPEGTALVSVSEDGETWTDVGEYELAEADLALANAGTVQSVFEFTAIDAKFVKIILNVGSNADVLGDSPAGGKIYWEFISIAEVEAIPADEQTPPVEYKFGDINGDGELNAKDYVQLKRYILGTYELDEAALSRSDINGDGTINAKDYMMLKRLIIGTWSPKA